ncbi:LPXTG cell wall anchor domain-containing protein [Pseudoclavibacter sp. VKM Ac-2888]|uniref:LPXTG cell wall anchor domain-containing protein n=1 Tax=Pseudoclavibacter sp. VKM Ac-2888 TaxID=2783830 RepID=UPI00188B201B|nr:LPXTG cell wall anchor domain-containing protein [Pseudoclavibacter sp. VKM Ac-2888]MBF4549058.1 LPXTG cell wall anchor domain-containing protein [Pseudoclavibacter sp. VKM Ac-2888]
MKKLSALLCACLAALLFSVVLTPALPANAYNQFDVGPELLSAELVTPTTVGGGDEVRIEWSVLSTRGVAYSAVSLATGSVFSPETDKVLGQYDTVVTGRDGDVVSGTTSFTTGGSNWAPGEWRVTDLGFFDEQDVYGGAFEDSPIIQALPRLQIDVGTDGDQEYPELVALEVDAPDEVRQSDVIWFNWTAREASRVTALSLTIVGPDGRTYQAQGFDRLAAARDGDLVSGSLQVTVNNFTWALGDYRVDSLVVEDEHGNRSPLLTAADSEALAAAATFTVVDAGGPDVTAPELLSAGFEQSTVRMGDEPDINWTIRDESDLDDITFLLEDDRGTVYKMRGSAGDRLGEIVRGVAGAWLTVTPWEDEVPKWHGGEYQVVGAELTDEFGNVTTLTPDNPVIAGLPRMIVLAENAPIPPRTPSPTVTATPSPTVTATPSPTATATPSPTESTAPSPTASPSPTETGTSTPAPTASSTAGPTDPSTGLPVPTQSVAPSTQAPTPTPTSTTSPAPSATPPMSSPGATDAPPQTPVGTPTVVTVEDGTAPEAGDQGKLASTGSDTLGPGLLGATALLGLGAMLLLMRRRSHGE